MKVKIINHTPIQLLERTSNMWYSGMVGETVEVKEGNGRIVGSPCYVYGDSLVILKQDCEVVEE